MRSRFSTSFCLSALTGVVTMLRLLPQRLLLNPFRLAGAQHDPLYINAGQVHAVRIELSWLQELFHLDDGHAGSRCHDRIEISRGLAEAQVAPAVGLPGLDQREVGLEGALHDVRLALKLAHLLAF